MYSIISGYQQVVVSTLCHPFSPLRCGFRLSMMPRSAAEIPCPIRRVRHRHCYRYPVSDMLDRPLICWPLFFIRWRLRHQSRRCRSTNRDTVNVLPTVIPDIVLPRLYRCRPHHTAYLLPSLSFVTLIILHLFFFVPIVSPLY